MIAMSVFILIGGGGNARVVIDIIMETELYAPGSKILVYDDNIHTENVEFYRGSICAGKIVDLLANVPCSLIPRQLSDDENMERPLIYVNTIGNPIVRRRLCEQFQCGNFYDENGNIWKNIIHPTAQISPTVKMGHGNIIYPGAVINAAAEIGNFNLINTYADVEHDCIVGDYNSISPRVVLCGGVKLDSGNMIGAGAVVIPLIKIGDDNVIGAGAAIIRQIDVRQTVVGVPGRDVRP